MKKEAKLTILVLVENGQVVAKSSVHFFPFKLALIQLVAVLSEFQGLKIGNQLMDYCAAFAKEKHHIRIILTASKSYCVYLKKRVSTFSG